MRAAPAAAPSGSLIQYEGWLNKSDPSGGNWKMRYCVLMPQTFCYYKEGDKKDNSLQGAFELRNARYQHGWSSSKKPPTAYPFGLVLPARTYYFAAASEAERDSWRYHIERTLAQLQGTPFDEASYPDGVEGVGGGMPPIAEETASYSASTTPAGISPDASMMRVMPAVAQQGAAPAAAAVGGAPVITFEVVAWAGTPAERVFTLRSGVDKLATLTVAKIKSNLSKHVGREVADLDIIVPGADGHDDVTCDDTWTADRLGLGQDALLLLRFKSEAVHAMAAAAGIAVPPPPPPSANRGSNPNPVPDEAARALRIGVGRQMTSTDDVEAGTAPPPLALKRVPEEDEEDDSTIAPVAAAVQARAGMGRQLTSADDRGSFVNDDDAKALRAGMTRQMTSTHDTASVEADAVAVRAGVGRQWTSTDDALEAPPSRAAPAPASIPAARNTVASGKTSPLQVMVRHSFTGASGGGMSPGAPAPTPAAVLSAITGLDDATTQRLQRRLKLRRLFNALAAGATDLYAGDAGALASYPEAPPTAAVERTEFAVALGVDEEMMGWDEYDPLLARLLVPSRGARGTFTWDDFSSMFREVQQQLDAATVKGAVAAAHAAAAALAPAPQAHVVASQPAPARSPVLSTTRKLSAISDISSTLQLGPAAIVHSPTAAASDASSPTAATSAPLPMPRKYAMQLTVDTPSGQAYDINLFAGDDAEAIAAQFIATHGLDASEHSAVLTGAIQHALLDAYQMELQDAMRLRADAVQEAEQAKAQAAEAANAASTAASARIAQLEAQLQEAQASAASAASSAATAAAEAASRSSLLEEDVRRLTTELAAATQSAKDTNAAFAAYRSEMDEAGRRRNAWERYVDGGAAVTAASPAVSFMGATHTPYTRPGAADTAAASVMHSSDWRAWAAEKRDILSRANADRATLIEENKRLRAALDGRGVEAEARLRSADEERATLAAEKHAITAARDKVEHELANVYAQWEADGRRWASERRRMTEQLDALLAAAALGGMHSAGTGGSYEGGFPASVGGAMAARADMEAVAKWAAERETILRNWGDESALLTSLWNKDKTTWAAQREAVLRSLHVAATNVQDALGAVEQPHASSSDTQDAQASAQRALLALQAAMQLAAAPVSDSMASISDALAPSARIAL